MENMKPLMGQTTEDLKVLSIQEVVRGEIWFTPYHGPTSMALVRYARRLNVKPQPLNVDSTSFPFLQSGGLAQLGAPLCFLGTLAYLLFHTSLDKL